MCKNLYQECIAEQKLHWAYLAPTVDSKGVSCLMRACPLQSDFLITELVDQLFHKHVSIKLGFPLSNKSRTPLSVAGKGFW